MDELDYQSIVDEFRADPRTFVTVERPQPDHAVLRLCDPENGNSMSGPLTVQFHDRLQELARDPKLRSIVITGTDPQFSVGGDWQLMKRMAHRMIAESDDGAAAPWRWIRQLFGGIARTIVGTDKVFIAAVNGAAAGVSLCFVFDCDIIVASEKARLLTAFGRVGLVPEVGMSWHLTRRIGYQRAFALFVANQTLTGQEAAAQGLINEAVPHERLMPRALEWCEMVRAQPRHTIEMAKPLLRGAADMSWHQAMLAEEFAEPIAFSTRAQRDAVADFERRAAKNQKK
jgi:2-(1,2-epoxy-1,2-dihydrophenyl)acetyl-CoA isomerase